MPRTSHIFVFPWGIDGLVAGWPGEVGNPNQGLRLAHALCAECHLVDKLPEQSPNLIAPTFEHIANTPGMNSAALTAALRTSHETMPNIIVKGSDLSDVIAYILSLNEHR